MNSVATNDCRQLAVSCYWHISILDVGCFGAPPTQAVVYEWQCILIVVFSIYHYFEKEGRFREYLYPNV